jgi:ferrochelatase
MNVHSKAPDVTKAATKSALNSDLLSGASLTDDQARPTGPLPEGHPGVQPPKVGVLLVNLGTPDGTSYWPMRRYLKEFLSDRRVIEAPKPIWWVILNGIILQTRPQKSGRAYDEVWNTEADEGPLLTFTRSQSDKLRELIGEETDLRGNRLVVDFAMRYGNPSIQSKMESLQDKGCDKVLIVPLYPQYAAATTATVNDKTFEALMKMRWQPAIRTAPPWHDDPAYVDALAISIEKHLASLDWEPELIMASYHGIPKSYHMKGDPYHCQCHKTTRLLLERLGWPKDRIMTTFQSRFGPQEWLQPYTDKTVEQLAKDGMKRLAIINPGFSSDCLETLEEIAGEAHEIFEEHGGEQFSHIPCLNDSDEGMAVIQTVVERELQGWL